MINTIVKIIKLTRKIIKILMMFKNEFLKLRLLKIVNINWK